MSDLFYLRVCFAGIASVVKCFVCRRSVLPGRFQRVFFFLSADELVLLPMPPPSHSYADAVAKPMGS